MARNRGRLVGVDAGRFPTGLGAPYCDALRHQRPGHPRPGPLARSASEDLAAGVVQVEKVG